MSDTSERKPSTSELKSDQQAEQINLKVRDADGNEVQFRIKRHTALRKLMDAYCSRKGVDLASYRFLFDGNRINDDDTPEKLGMEDMDSIDAMLFQQGGGGAVHGYSPHTALPVRFPVQDGVHSG